MDVYNCDESCASASEAGITCNNGFCTKWIRCDIDDCERTEGAPCPYKGYDPAYLHECESMLA